ncbi:hypothetical protein KA183_13150 [bacterium]|nr:hypothetical protein [bacterium]QQR57776.1 MAG: hypothetical protein IPG59_22860 [Candidatus Melainabacteria bacterium]
MWKLVCLLILLVLCGAQQQGICWSPDIELGWEAFRKNHYTEAENHYFAALTKHENQSAKKAIFERIATLYSHQNLSADQVKRRTQSNSNISEKELSDILNFMILSYGKFDLRSKHLRAYLLLPEPEVIEAETVKTPPRKKKDMER